MRSRLSSLTTEFFAARSGVLNRAGNERADRSWQAGNGVHSETALPNSLERKCVKAECYDGHWLGLRESLQPLVKAVS